MFSFVSGGHLCRYGARFSRISADRFRRLRTSLPAYARRNPGLPFRPSEQRDFRQYANDGRHIVRRHRYGPGSGSLRQIYGLSNLKSCAKNPSNFSLLRGVQFFSESGGNFLFPQTVPSTACRFLDPGRPARFRQEGQ